MSENTSRKIGFIGLGIMGAPMAGHLLAAGHQLFVNTHGPVPDPFGTQALVCPTAADVAKQAEVIFIMVPDTPDVEKVLFSENGVAAGLASGAKGKIVVDMSSIDPIATKEFAKKILALGAGYIDAPVSGGEVGAKAASLTIMCGGDEGDFGRVRPLLEKMGKNITLVGGNGDGQTTKVANQIIVALNIAAVGEALVFASKAGADPAKVRQALMGGFASSRILEVHGERMIKRTFAPGSGADGGVCVQPHPGSARRAHDQARLRAGLPHLAAPEGPEPGTVGRPRPGCCTAADGQCGAADERLRGAGPWPGRPFRPGPRPGGIGPASGGARRILIQPA